MSSSAAFLSYARHDDTNNYGHLSKLRTLLEREMQSITGDVNFRIFQDSTDVGWGQQWQSRINQGIDGSLLLIPIISPMFFNRRACRDEWERFVERESKLGRNDLILPIYFVEIPKYSLENEDNLIATSSKRQYEDWRNFRHEDLDTVESKKRIASLAQKMNNALQRAPTEQEIELMRKREIDGELKRIQQKISGPFRSSPVLQKLSEKLNSAGVDTLERLKLKSVQDLRKADLSNDVIKLVAVELAKYGHSLRGENQKVHPIDQLILTPSCRAAVRNAGIETVDVLASKSWNDLMLTRHFLPVHIKEVSLRLKSELDRDIRQTDEPRLTYHDVLARDIHV